MNKKDVSRRMILKSGLAACAGIYSLEAIAKGAEEVKKAKKGLPIGLQLWTVRTECAKDFPGTIAAVAKMGYDGVEFAGYYERSAQDVRKMLDDNGLKCCGTHTHLDTLMGDNLAKTIEFNKVIGNKYLIVPWLDPKTHTTKESWLEVANVLNELAEKVKPEGMVVGYHAHAGDFKPIDGERPWDILFDNTSKDVTMQIDTANTMMGGADPVAYLKKYPGRSLTIHIKEYSPTNKKALIGEGDVNWKEVFALCESTGGTQWYIIEEESGEYPPLEAAEKSLKDYRELRSRLA
ncbi:MAG: sugar phosphate isomerase/epimerase [Planctomycetota bacterium]